MAGEGPAAEAMTPAAAAVVAVAAAVAAAATLVAAAATMEAAEVAATMEAGARVGVTSRFERRHGLQSEHLTSSITNRAEART